jgi:hypothetical protein
MRSTSSDQTLYHDISMKTVFALLPIAALLAFQAPALAAPSVCTFDRSKGDNSIGMRNGFVLRQKGNDTVAIYDSLPSSIGGRTLTGVTLSSSRTLTFYNTPIAAARSTLLANPFLYNELLGFKSEKGFKAVNDNLLCTSTSAQSKSIAELPDGTYSYWTGKPNPADRKMTSEALLKAGGILYTFTKKGDKLTGNFSPIDNESICVEGTINGNSLTGMAYPADGLGSPSTSLFSWHASGYLQVGSWEPKKADKPGHYHQAKLDLTAFNPVVLDRTFTPKASCMSKWMN